MARAPSPARAQHGVTGCEGHPEAPPPSPSLTNSPDSPPLQSRIRLYAVVIMPDHVHMVFAPRRNTDGWPFPLVDILQSLKSATAHRINRLMRLTGPVWEEESFDHILRSDESLKEKCEYLPQNPVRRGIVARPEDYPWL